MKKVNISLELSEPLRKIVIQALEPELVETGLRTQSEVSTTEAGIILSINADDTSALRAAINSYLRWIHCIITTANTFNPKNV
ncbi:KEOPS complex subunit Pcc1 [[Eubacterium] cellulosolvens]